MVHNRQLIYFPPLFCAIKGIQAQIDSLVRNHIIAQPYETETIFLKSCGGSRMLNMPAKDKDFVIFIQKYRKNSMQISVPLYIVTLHAL